MRSNELANKYNITPQTFARELFLDSIECESKSYLLPSLARNSFKLDKEFAKLDKILEEKYRSSTFSGMGKNFIQESIK